MDHDVVDLRLVLIARSGQRRQAGNPDQNITAGGSAAHVERRAALRGRGARDLGEGVQRGRDRGVVVPDLDLDVGAAAGAELDHHLAQPYLLAHIQYESGALLQVAQIRIGEVLVGVREGAGLVVYRVLGPGAILVSAVVAEGVEAVRADRGEYHRGRGGGGGGGRGAVRRRRSGSRAALVVEHPADHARGYQDDHDHDADDHRPRRGAVRRRPAVGGAGPGPGGPARPPDRVGGPLRPVPVVRPGPAHTP